MIVESFVSQPGGAALDGILGGELFRDGVGQWVGEHRHVTGGMAQSHIDLGGDGHRCFFDEHPTHHIPAMCP